MDIDLNKWKEYREHINSINSEILNSFKKCQEEARQDYKKRMLKTFSFTHPPQLPSLSFPTLIKPSIVGYLDYLCDDTKNAN